MECVRWNTMPSLHPAPIFDYYYKACRKGDPEAKAVAVSYSSAGVLVDASEITGLPKDNFEVRDGLLLIRLQNPGRACVDRLTEVDL